MSTHGQLEPGDLFAGHRIEAVAGRGGMGIVYRAVALDLERVVALKVITPDLAVDPGFRDRFSRETRAAASIDHPHVVPVFTAGEQDGRLYFTMRLVEGDDLRALIRRELRLGPRRAAAIVAQVGGALDAAHARGIIHRDVKPANILLTEAAGRDHAYLTDFGLTKRVHSAAADTRAGGWVGTLGYVAPEQIRGEGVDPRTDVYALGCILFHALTGGAPYARDSDEATLLAHLHDPPPAVGAWAPDVPAGFEEVIARSLAKAPEERYASAGALGRAAEYAAGGDPAEPVTRATATSATRRPRAQPAPPQATDPRTSAAPTGSAPRRRRRPSAVAIGLLVAVLLGLGGLGVGLAALRAGSGDLGRGAPRASVPPPVAPAADAAGRLAATVPVGRRPNALAIAAGRLWVASQSEPRLRLIDTNSNRTTRSAPNVGIGAAALAVGFDSVWIVKSRTQTLLRYSARERTRRGGPLRLPPGEPVAVATANRAVWVGTRPGRTEASAAATRVDVGPALAVGPQIAVADGVQDLAVGEGSVWVLGRRRARVTRIDQLTRRVTRYPVGGRPQRLAVGAGAVWVSDDNGQVLRLDIGTGRERRIGVGRRPRGIAVSPSAVWVANSLDGTVSRLDPRTGDPVGTAIAVGAQPSAVVIDRSTLWVSLLADDAVARVDFPR